MKNAIWPVYIGMVFRVTNKYYGIPPNKLAKIYALGEKTIYLDFAHPGLMIERNQARSVPYHEFVTHFKPTRAKFPSD